MVPIYDRRPGEGCKELGCPTKSLAKFHISQLTDRPRRHVKRLRGCFNRFPYKGSYYPSKLPHHCARFDFL